MTVADPLVPPPAFSVPLDGDWRFAADPLKKGLVDGWFACDADRSRWRRVQLPRYWNGYPALAKHKGWGWYSRTVRLDAVKTPLSIHFAGVDDDAMVWINGTIVGRHEGYAEPFVVDAGVALRPGNNTIVVLVKDQFGGGGLYAPVTLIGTRELGYALHGTCSGKMPRKSASWVRDAVVYSVYLRSFSREGTFAGLEKRLADLVQLGVTVLWLLPIHPVGVRKRKGTLGSPYAVRDYYGINPEFGTMDDFRHLLRAVHRHGMKLIIDLVANHTSWDSVLMRTHPGWFAHDRAGKIVSPNADWSDVAKLDYVHPGLYRYMIDMMKWWVRDIGIDGFRCDVAELVPRDFWEKARAELDRLKPVMMLSEGSLPEHHLCAFDVTYSWNTYDVLEPLLKGKRPVDVIDEILRVERAYFPLRSLRMRFVTNHDKNAWDAPAVRKFGDGGLALGVVLENTLPGVPMIYTGEEVANARRLSLFEKVGVDWSRPHDIGGVYAMMFRLRRRHRALVSGTMLRLENTPGGEVYAFVRRAGKDRVLIVLNFAAGPRTVMLRIPKELFFPRERVMRLTDVFSGNRIRIERGVEMHELRLNGQEHAVYVQARERRHPAANFTGMSPPASQW
jgi:hypothetical protein